MRARTWEWWQDFPERRPLTDLVRRADHRKKEIGSEYSRRPPFHSEGFRIARQMLAGIPDKISLDSKSEYEDVSKLLSAFLSPPLGEPLPRKAAKLHRALQVHPVYRDALRRHYEELDSPPKIIFRPALRWQRKAAGRTRLRRAKRKVRPIAPSIRPSFCATSRSRSSSGSWIDSEYRHRANTYRVVASWER